MTASALTVVPLTQLISFALLVFLPVFRFLPFVALQSNYLLLSNDFVGKCLFLSGLIPTPLTGMEDFKALDYGIGLTNIVERTTPSSSDLSR